jgi:hypothetical protein
MGHTQTDGNPALSKEKTRCPVLSENVGDNNRCDSLAFPVLSGKGFQTRAKLLQRRWMTGMGTGRRFHLPVPVQFLAAWTGVWVGRRQAAAIERKRGYS